MVANAQRVESSIDREDMIYSDFIEECVKKVGAVLSSGIFFPLQANIVDSSRGRKEGLEVNEEEAIYDEILGGLVVDQDITLDMVSTEHISS